MLLRGLEPGRRPALLVSECQNNMTNPKVPPPGGLGRYANERGIIPKIDALAAAFRSRGLPVVFATLSALPGFVGFPANCLLAANIRKGGALVRGTWPAKIDDRLHVADSDIVCDRMHGMASFTGTELDMILRGLKVDTIVLVGVSTNIALPGTATEAVALGYNVVLAEDCTAGGTPETHDMQIRMHFPFLATVSDSASVVECLGAETAAI